MTDNFFDGENLKYLVLFFASILSIQSAAASLCPKLKTDRPDDMQIVDTDLDRKSAFKAMEKLQKILAGSKMGLNEHERTLARMNALKTIKGYFLRKDADKESKTSPTRKTARKAYCEFLKKDGYWHD